MDAAFENARPPTQAVQRLVVSAPPSFVQGWLLPRLAGFDAQGAEVELQASQTMDTPAWQASEPDKPDEPAPTLAIRYGQGPWPGVAWSPLMTDVLYPVCAPSLLEASAGFDSPIELADHELLHVSWPSRQGIVFTGWQDWLAAVGAADMPVTVRHRYSLFSLAMDQAVAGQGLVLASHAVVAHRIERGELVRPFGDRFVMPAPLTYDLVAPALGTPPVLVARFIEWLQSQAQAFEHDMPQPTHGIKTARP